MLKVRQDIRCVGEEDQPDECCDWQHDINLFPPQWCSVREIGDDERNPGEKQIPYQKRIMNCSTYLRANPPYQYGKYCCAGQQKKHHQPIFVVRKIIKKSWNHCPSGMPKEAR